MIRNSVKFGKNKSTSSKEGKQKENGSSFSKFKNLKLGLPLFLLLSLSNCGEYTKQNNAVVSADPSPKEIPLDASEHMLSKSKSAKKNLTTSISADIFEIFARQNEILKDQPLDNILFDSYESFLFFEEWLDASSFFDLKLISRDDFNALHGNFLVELKDTLNTSNITHKSLNKKSLDTKKKQYTFFLPQDLKVYELPAIIKKIHTTTFGTELPNASSYVEVQKKIKSAIKYLFSLRNSKNKKQVQHAINKYYNLFQDFFPGASLGIDTVNTRALKGNRAYFDSELREIVQKDYTAIGADSILKNVDKAVADNIYQHFFESFFEHGSELLANFNDIGERINIKQLQAELTTFKQHNVDKNRIAKKEQEIIKKLFFMLKKELKSKLFITGGLIDPFLSSAPAHVLSDTLVPGYHSLTCVGATVLYNSIFRDLGIKHHVISSLDHMTMGFELANGKKIIFDPYKNENIYEYKIKGTITTWKKISYNDGEAERKVKAHISNNCDNLIISGLIINKVGEMRELGTDRNLKEGDRVNFKKQIYNLNRAKALNSKDPAIWFYLGQAHYYLGDYDLALQEINKAIQISPDVSLFWRIKLDISLKKKDKDAIVLCGKKIDELGNSFFQGATW